MPFKDQSEIFVNEDNCTENYLGTRNWNGFR